MADTATALNRFGLGARPDETLPSEPRRWLLDQFGRFEARTAAFDSVPSRKVLAGELAGYLESVRGMAGRGRRRRAAGAATMEPPVMRDGAATMPGDAMIPGDAMAGGNAMAGGEEPDPIKQARRFARQQGRDGYLAAVGARASAALLTPAPLVERLVHFWANHFAVSADKLTVIGMAGHLEFEAIRPHVLGTFGAMLAAVEHHPAMLLYLDQAQSIGPASPIGARFGNRGPRRLGLNENLAREILELHTLGVRTGYSQADVTELARAMTGFTVSGITRGPAARFAGVAGDPGDFVFAPRIHEPGTRTILGKSYPQEGEAQARAVMADLAVHPSTARHIATKLARHFSADVPPPSLVARLEAAFLRSGGDLPTVYRALIEAPEPWAAGSPKFKTPWEWSISAMRALGTRQVPAQATAGLMMQLGQPVWRPGSPAGFDDVAPSWAGPDAVLRRVEAAERMASRAGNLLDARTLAPKLFPAGLSAATTQAIARAESPGQGLALMLVAPEFMRR